MKHDQWLNLVRTELLCFAPRGDPLSISEPWSAASGVTVSRVICSSGGWLDVQERKRYKD